ncbi:MAG TPA: hypothetical protein DDZ21_07215, partial [Gammaproteobacteria bacterium]|nr:hypothetical protein [Gammaproteobacteria bacterium]
PESVKANHRAKTNLLLEKYKLTRKAYCRFLMRRRQPPGKSFARLRAIPIFTEVGSYNVPTRGHLLLKPDKIRIHYHISL